MVVNIYRYAKDIDRKNGKRRKRWTVPSAFTEGNGLHTCGLKRSTELALQPLWLGYEEPGSGPWTLTIGAETAHAALDPYSLRYDKDF